ncbi:MAG: hypothetical protein LKF99_05815 [Bifidobacterium sp.]|nr:hypothetical protein [Bifidobacterium sp.]
MTNNNSYPSRPAAFFVQRTPDKARLFIAEISLGSRSLRPVATVNMKSDDDVARLVSSLNTAAWTGDRSE